MTTKKRTISQCTNNEEEAIELFYNLSEEFFQAFRNRQENFYDEMATCTH